MIIVTSYAVVGRKKIKYRRIRRMSWPAAGRARREYYNTIILSRWQKTIFLVVYIYDYIIISWCSFSYSQTSERV